jgi:hypothetical protein
MLNVRSYREFPMFIKLLQKQKYNAQMSTRHAVVSQPSLAAMSDVPMSSPMDVPL